MSRRNWYLLLGAILVALSAILYSVHFAIFRDSNHMFLYMMSDIAFLPLEVLFVTLIIDSLLSERDKRLTLEKLNMVIGAFFSEVGTELLRSICTVADGSQEKRELFSVSGEWKDNDFKRVNKEFAEETFKVDSRQTDLEKLKGRLVGKRDFMVRLLENPMLLEHETFTDLLWAVFHLTEELDTRTGLSGLSDADYAHLSGDLGRAYNLLVREWLLYMRHLEKSYPYLFSLAVRLNPFNPDACAEIR
ncbi:MAG: hypothetical protein MUO75_07560 [Actinobacteria bacterium]|nr:hypothetical protein [Actinomycetota bacterium]